MFSFCWRWWWIFHLLLQVSLGAGAFLKMTSILSVLPFTTYPDPPLTAALLAESPVILRIMSSSPDPLGTPFFLLRKKKKGRKSCRYPAGCDLALGKEIADWEAARLLLCLTSSLVKTSWGNTAGSLPALWRGTLCRKGKHKHKHN